MVPRTVMVILLIDRSVEVNLETVTTTASQRPSAYRMEQEWSGRERMEARVRQLKPDRDRRTGGNAREEQHSRPNVAVWSVCSPSPRLDRFSRPL